MFEFLLSVVLWRDLFAFLKGVHKNCKPEHIHQPSSAELPLRSIFLGF